ncbi:MAG TPA: HAD family hydrolase [Candidatus Latescibacteria bacterium]|nr:HAD family hydrolase [Candidatus Latescibacterota bacterium]HOF61597.1 HAD family hydrolase [Candidatus Latescibacterota bacterium]HOM57254.1 HAD family hydrolase [Candidatus Latescibacterota bacterium]HOS63820.1 HAD family hydrolase [Candidatus Latescibacterota bacterium]HOT36330.1 HAD family hydrolase [Candidatus Latescibacterota bacterium]
MLLRPDVIFFDYGNTLVKDTEDWFGDISRYLAPLGMELTEDRFRIGKAAAEHYAGSYRQKNGTRTRLEDRFWFNYCKAFLEAAFGDGAGRLAEEMHAVQFFTNEIYPDTHAVLRELRRRGYRLGVISNWEAPTLPSLFERFQLTQYFEKILPSRDAEASKPDPLIFQKAMSALAVKPEDAVHVGDSFPCDVEGAQGVGITPVWLNEKGGAAPDGSSVLQIRNLSGLLSLLA